jgi:hypothetical protein
LNYSQINLEPCSTVLLVIGFNQLPVYQSMAIRAQSDQILFSVVAQMAPRLDVMYLQVRPTSAPLASPSITPQDLMSQRPIRLGRKAFSASLGKSSIHGVAPTP